MGTPAALARVAGAVAAGLAETGMYWSASSAPCRDYLDLLIRSGWTPDAWTAAVLAGNSTDVGAETAGDGESEASDVEPDDVLDDGDRDGEGDPGSEVDSEAGDGIDTDEEPQADVHDPAAWAVPLLGTARHSSVGCRAVLCPGTTAGE